MGGAGDSGLVVKYVLDSAVADLDPWLLEPHDSLVVERREMRLVKVGRRRGGLKPAR